jgi:hypothetical protein
MAEEPGNGCWMPKTPAGRGDPPGVERGGDAPVRSDALHLQVEHDLPEALSVLPGEVPVGGGSEPLCEGSRGLVGHGAPENAGTVLGCVLKRVQRCVQACVHTPL